MFLNYSIKVRFVLTGTMYAVKVRNYYAVGLFNKVSGIIAKVPVMIVSLLCAPYC